MRWKIIFASVMISMSAWAETHLLIWPYFPGLRIERGEDQQLEGRMTWTSGAGVLINDWYGSLETERFQISNSEGNTSVKRSYQDVSLWGGYALHGADKWKFLGTAGFGLYKETVKTRVGTISDSDTSKEKTHFGLGAEWIFLEPSTIFTFSFGGRFLWSKDFDPSPQPQLLIKVGFKL